MRSMIVMVVWLAASCGMATAETGPLNFEGTKWIWLPLTGEAAKKPPAGRPIFARR